MADDDGVSEKRAVGTESDDDHTIETLKLSLPNGNTMDTESYDSGSVNEDPDTTIDSCTTDGVGSRVDKSYDTGSDEELSEESDNGEDKDEEEDEPPKLKYIRVNKLPANFFVRDALSTIRTFKAHRASVLSLYTDGKYFASGSMDGTIVIGSIEDEKDIVAFDFKRPIHAVILDQNYHRSRSFISGGMSDKGPIVSIQKIDDLILWMSDAGITVYHITTKRVISTIKKPDNSPRSDLYWPRVHFPEVDRILIAWADHIWSLRVSIKSVDDGDNVLTQTRAVQEKKIEVEHIFKFDSLIAGISSFKDDLWMILTYNTPERDPDTNKMAFPPPDLKLVNSASGDIEHEEEIGLKNIQGLGLNDYLLGSHIGEKTPSYFIMSAKDGVIAQETQLDDRLNWYLEKRRFFDAWNISQHLVSPIKRLNFGTQYVDSLITLDNWEEASDFLKKLLWLNLEDLPEADTKSTILTGRSDILLTEEMDNYVKEVTSQWSIWADIFIKSNHIKELTDIIPTNAKLNLPHNIYNTILEYWLSKIDDNDTFYRLIDWDPDLYDIKLIQSKLEELLERDDSNDRLRKSLTELYVKSFNPIKAVPHLIHLRDYNLISFLASNHLLTNFKNDIPRIITLRFKPKEIEELPVQDLGDKLADIIDILVENRHEIPSGDIIQLMFDNHLEFINYFYLEKLAAVDEYLSYPFGNERIKLYANFDRPKLLPFLTKYSKYDIDEAIRLCEDNDFVEELVYLLGKIGENKKALMLIIDELDDPEKAIKFAKHQNDKEAWSILLDYSVKKPNFIKALIECADDQSNSYYDPITILERMPHNVKIEGLKNSVTKISNNNDLNLMLNQLILKIVYKQSEEVSSVYQQQQLKGVEVDISSDEIKNLVNRYETIVMYSEPGATDKKLTNELKLLNDTALMLNKKTHSGLNKKLEHLFILKKHIE
ncbi:hypothetical protein QCA50_018150 [Cerrena zonata]|uniref:Vps41 beta-propeller domain-containing protein n=1 Tax=Cerrena zonata TaxID=2478898 RepID=A0AAW0FBM8_9APHY